jgi:adiponectin receptor
VEGSAVTGFVFFMLASIVHTPFSVGFHLFMPVSQKVFNLWRRLDVCAIFAGSVCFTVALSFFVLPLWGTLITSAIAVVLAAMAMSRFWQTPDDQALDYTKHAAFVGSIIMCYWFPMVFAIVRDSIGAVFSLSTGMALGEFVCLILGGFAFASMWPQKFYPGKFNVWGHSHQMLHVAAMMAHGFKFVFLWENYKRSMA